MNDAQCSMLEMYGGNIVCIDGTHGLNAYNFELVTAVLKFLHNKTFDPE